MKYVQAPDGHVFETERPECHSDCKPLTKAEGQRLKAKQSAAKLREILRPGARVYCVLRSVSSSGMSRRISFYAIEGGEMRFLDGYIADVLSGVTRGRKQGLRVSGCGMDMGLHVVHNLGAALWPSGTPKPHGSRNGEPDSSGGYALKHEWL